MNVSKFDDPSDLSTDKVLEQARMALAEIQALHLIAHALIGFEDVTELLQAVIDSVVNVLAADRVALITFDLQARQVVHFMKGGASIDEIVEIPFEELWGGLVGLVIREGKPVLSPKGTLDPRASLEAQRRRVETNAGSIIIVPIRYQDNVLGTLSAVNRPDQRDFNEWDVELMLVMASQCAIAIENARLYSELQNTNAELERRVTERTAELIASNARLQAEIVEHQQAAQALRASEERYRIVIENMSDGLTMIDTDNRFSYVSQRFCDLSGYTAEELIGQPMTMLTLHQATLDTHLARRRQGEHSLYQLDWKRKDGRSLSTLISGTPLLDDQGEFRGAFAIVTDITERIQAEEERLAHLRFFENMDQVNRAIQATNDLDEMMGSVLDLMLTLFDCDRAWLSYPCDPDAPMWEVPMERTRPEYPGALKLKLKVPMDSEVASVARILRSADGPVKFGPQEENGIPYWVEHSFSVRSFMGMAIYPKVDKPYMFGMHQCTHPRIWTTEEQRLFQEIGRRLTDALTSLLTYRALQESELRYREIFENTSDIIVIFDLTDDGRAKFLDISPTWEIMIGANRAELLGKFLDDFGMDAVAQRLLEKLHICLETKTPIDYEETITGTGYWHIHTTLIPVMNATGSVYRVVAMSRNITVQKQMEAERRATEARFRAFVDHATDALFFHEWGTILDINLQACLSLGYSREELIGMRPHDFDVDIDQAFMDQIEARLNAGEVMTFETRHRRKDGTSFPVEVRVRGFVQGESRFAVSVARDITERKQSEARMRALIDAIPDMLVRYDREGRYLEIKAATSIPLNYAIPDAIGKTVSEMLPHDPQLVEHILRRIERALDTNEMDVQEYKLTYDGKTLYREARTTPINEHEVLMLIRDITKRKEAEAGLQRYNQRLSILHRIDKGILSAQSPQEVAETVLEQLAQLIPCEFLSVILHNDELTEERIFALRHTPELGQYSQEIQPVVQNEVLETLKSGKTAVAPDLLQQAGSHARLALELESRGIRSALASPMMVHGKLIGTIALAAREVGFFTSEHQQITEEVAAQIAIALHQAKLNDQIRQHNTELEKRVRERTTQLEHVNRELELFSYSVSHDLRAPLRAIQGFAEIIVRRHRESLNEEGRRYFDHIITASEQMNQLIIDLLDYARLGRQRIRLERVSVAALVAEVIENLETHIDETGAQIHLMADLPDVLGDTPLLKRIFANLLQNALIYHQFGLPPVINITCTLEPGYAIVQVTDNGIGIPEEFREKIFNIFQRLHSQDQYPGTGIGLAIVRRSVELLNGAVWVDSLTKVGSTFCVRLPLPTSII